MTPRSSEKTQRTTSCTVSERIASARRLELIVYEMLYYGPWAEVAFKTQTAEYSLVGLALSSIWLLLLEDSYKRGDWLRPVTGWPAERTEIREWEQATGEAWKGKR